MKDAIDNNSNIVYNKNHHTNKGGFNMKINKVQMFQCSECGKAYEHESYAEGCLRQHKMKNDTISHSTPRMSSTIGRNQIVYYAENLTALEEYLRHMTKGICLNEWDYESFKYPCYVIITEYEESVPYSDSPYPDEYVSVRMLDEYIEELNSKRVEIEDKMRDVEAKIVI